MAWSRRIQLVRAIINVQDSHRPLIIGGAIMSKPIDMLKIWKKGLWCVFLISLIWFLYQALSISEPETSCPTCTSTSQTDHSDIMLVASLTSTFISLAGVIVTTTLSWRKEKREKKSFELDNAKKELEIEKLRAELERVKDPWQRS